MPASLSGLREVTVNGLYAPLRPLKLKLQISNCIWCLKFVVFIVKESQERKHKKNILAEKAHSIRRGLEH